MHIPLLTDDQKEYDMRMFQIVNHKICEDNEKDHKFWGKDTTTLWGNCKLKSLDINFCWSYERLEKIALNDSEWERRLYAIFLIVDDENKGFSNMRDFTDLFINVVKNDKSAFVRGCFIDFINREDDFASGSEMGAYLNDEEKRSFLKTIEHIAENDVNLIVRDRAIEFLETIEEIQERDVNWEFEE